MRIYVCSPYRADNIEKLEENVAFARECCRAIFDAGHDPYAPHLFFPQFCNDGDPNERAKCMEAAMRELLLCDGMMIFGETVSEGMCAEIDFVNKFRIPIFHATNHEPGRDVLNAVVLFEVRSGSWARAGRVCR